MNRILVPVDFSKYAENAANYAAMIARHSPNTHVYFINVYAVPLIADYNLPTNVQNYIDQSRDQAQNDMLKFEAKFLKDHPLLNGKVSVQISYGFIAEKILEYAQQIKANMIVMGTKGAGNMLERIIGTIAQKVMEKATIPVWIIPKSAKLQYPNWLLYAADYQNHEVDAINSLLEIIKPFNIRCKILHIHDRVELNVGHQIEAMASYLADTFENENIEVANLHRNSVIDGLETYIKNQKPDILALSRHHHTLLDRLFESSVTKHFTYTSHVPLLVFSKS
jgi:nucleotide-binding universal stress UspA family protein